MAVVLIGHTLGSAFSVPTSYEVSVKQVYVYAFMSRNCKGNVCAHPAGTSDVTTAQITYVDSTGRWVSPGLPRGWYRPSFYPQSRVESIRM